MPNPTAMAEPALAFPRSGDAADAAAPAEPAFPLRFVTAASLFDGHDAAINEEIEPPEKSARTRRRRQLENLIDP